MVALDVRVTISFCISFSLNLASSVQKKCLLIR